MEEWLWNPVTASGASIFGEALLGGPGVDVHRVDVHGADGWAWAELVCGMGVWHICHKMSKKVWQVCHRSEWAKFRKC